MATRTISATREIEGRDSVGLYLDEIARTALLDAASEVELSKTIEAGLYAEHLLAEGRVGRRKGGAPMTATASSTPRRPPSSMPRASFICGVTLIDFRVRGKTPPPSEIRLLS